VPGCTEAEDAEMLSISRHDKRAPADQACAKQGCDGDIVAIFAEWEAIAGIRDEMRRKAAVARVAGEARTIAQILMAAPAIGTFAAGVTEPGNADAFAYSERGHIGAECIHPADHLMAGNNWIGNAGQFSINDMQISPAYTAGTHLDPHFAGPGQRIFPWLKPQRRARRRQDHGVHLVRCPHANVSTLHRPTRPNLIRIKSAPIPPRYCAHTSTAFNQEAHMNTKSVIPVGTQRAITRRETNPFSLLQQEIDRLFEGVSRSIPGLATTTMPSMDISETDKMIEITAELPGLEKKDVELNVTENLLTIRGEKKNEREEKNKDYHLVERSYGAFSRSVELPSGVKVEDISAEIANGVLKVTVQKPAPKQTKQIEIKTAAA
jgi:HSP20 family protein